MWGNSILGDQQHIQHLQSLMPNMMTTKPMSSMKMYLRLPTMDYQLSQRQLFHWGVGGEYL